MQLKIIHSKVSKNMSNHNDMFFFIKKYDTIKKIGECVHMIDEEIRRLNEKIANIRIAKESLQTLLDQANATLETINPIKQITDTQMLANETIDRGKMENMKTTCNNIATEASNAIESCNTAITSLTERINELVAARDGGQ